MSFATGPTWAAPPVRISGTQEEHLHGIKEGTEECDLTDLGGQTCQGLGYSGGTLGCTASCMYDATNCNNNPVCGNGVKEGTEECDGSDLGGQTCVGLGFQSGTLGCTGSCTYDTSGCQSAQQCGNGIKEGTEGVRAPTTRPVVSPCSSASPTQW
jgi:hypothetical protein